MTTSTMTLLFSTLAILAAAAAVILHAVRWLPFPEARQRLGDLLDGQEIPLAFVVATVATLGSLYLSEVAHFVPSRLCWYQRIAMYPLSLILLTALASVGDLLTVLMTVNSLVSGSLALSFRNNLTAAVWRNIVTPLVIVFYWISQVRFLQTVRANEA